MSILAKLLTESEAYDPEYGGGLCNHLPLALTALDQMGATPGQLADYRRTHISWLETLPEQAAEPDGAWPFRKADHASFVDLQADFRQRLLQLVEIERLDDRFDLFHSELASIGVGTSCRTPLPPVLSMNRASSADRGRGTWFFVGAAEKRASRCRLLRQRCARCMVAEKMPAHNCSNLGPDAFAMSMFVLRGVP